MNLFFANGIIRVTERIYNEEKLIQLPKGIKNLKVPEDSQWTVLKAKKLRLWFTQHPEFLSAITDRLNLQGCNLSLLPKEIGHLKALEELVLDHNYLATLPTEIGQLKALQLLILNYNRLARLPKEIGQLQALKDLWLDYNRFTALPKEIGQLEALIGLQVNNNRLATLPKEIDRLKLLQKEGFRLKENGLVELPKGLERFNDQLKLQNKKLQLKNLLDRMLLCLKNGHNCKDIAVLLTKIEKYLGKEVLSELENFLLDGVFRKAFEIDPKLRAKLKDPKFKQKVFSRKEVDPKLKAIAIVQFWKAKKNKIS